MYPNPNDGIFNLLNKGATGKYNINVLDMQGRVVFSQTTTFVSTQPEKIDLSFIKSGVYVIKLTNENGVEQHRIIKR